MMTSIILHTVWFCSVYKISNQANKRVDVCYSCCLLHCSTTEPAACMRFVGHNIIIQGQKCVTKPSDFHSICSDNKSKHCQDIVKTSTILKHREYHEEKALFQRICHKRCAS